MRASSSAQLELLPSVFTSDNVAEHQDVRMLGGDCTRSSGRRGNLRGMVLAS